MRAVAGPGDRNEQSRPGDHRQQVFQTSERLCEVTLSDVDGALEASRGMLERDRRSYMASLGIDLDRVRKYYDVVRRLEEAARRLSSSCTLTLMPRPWRPYHPPSPGPPSDGRR